MFILSPPRECKPPKSRVLGSPDPPLLSLAPRTVRSARQTAVTGEKRSLLAGPRERLPQLCAGAALWRCQAPITPGFLFCWPFQSPTTCRKAHLCGTTGMEVKGSCLQGSSHVDSDK